MNKINVLIVGVSGFIGSSLKRYIETKYHKWKVYGIDKKIKGSKSNIKLNIENKNKLKNILERLRPKYIFYLCGDTRSNDFKKLLNSNVYTTFIFLDTIKRIKNYKPRIVIPSSAAEYGKCPSSKPITEEAPCRPVSMYGISKLLQTKISLVFAWEGLDVVIPRIFNIIGWATPYNLSIGRFSRELSLIHRGKRKLILYTKNLDAKRDFVDIQDVCNCLVATAMRGKKGEIYNICRGKSYKVRNVLSKLLKISGKENIMVTERKYLRNGSDSVDSYGSNKKIRKIYNDIKFKPLKQSLEETYSYYLSGA